jgi:hypothetical protein
MYWNADNDVKKGKLNENLKPRLPDYYFRYKVIILEGDV